MNKEAVGSSETLVPFYQISLHHIPENSYFQNVIGFTAKLIREMC
jgi:hypothetical protein